MTVIYIYLIATMECIAKPVVTTVGEFKENPILFYPDWNDETMKFSETLLNNPIIDSKNGELREMAEVEKIKAGKRVLDDGSYLDEVNETIVTIAKPNEWSVWDKDSHTWKVDNDLLNKKLKELREKKQLLQRQLASALEIDTPMYSRIERGERKAKREQVVLLAKLLGANEKDLLQLWLADKVYDVLAEEDCADGVINMVAENIREYGK